METIEQTYFELRQAKIAELIKRLVSGEEHMSYSSLSAFAESPKHFIEYKLRERTQTPSMFYGNVVHCLILEPEQFEKRYTTVDDSRICLEIGGAKPRATNKYKEWYANFEAENTGKAIIDNDTFLDAKAAAFAVKSNWPASNVINKCNTREIDAEWDYMNIHFKGKIDLKGEGVIADLKTCADASVRKFHRHIIEYDYHLQAAMYLTSCGEIQPYYLIAVDKTGGVSTHLLEKQLIETALERYTWLMDKLNSCILLDAWNRSYDFWAERGDGVFVCEKPAYMY